MTKDDKQKLLVCILGSYTGASIGLWLGDLVR